jgi:hypothetical protein
MRVWVGTVDSGSATVHDKVTMSSQCGDAINSADGVAPLMDDLMGKPRKFYLAPSFDGTTYSFYPGDFNAPATETDTICGSVRKSDTFAPWFPPATQMKIPFPKSGYELDGDQNSPGVFPFSLVDGIQFGVW